MILQRILPLSSCAVAPVTGGSQLCSCTSISVSSGIQQKLTHQAAVLSSLKAMRKSGEMCSVLLHKGHM